MTLLYTAWQLAAFAIGACAGSFSALAVYRVPVGTSLVHPPSACPTCGTRLGPSELVPMLSWIAQGARCRHCDAPISPAYALVELTGALLGWLTFRRIVPSPEALDPVTIVAFFIWLIFATLLLISALTDIRSRIIPAFASVYAIPAGIAAHAILSAIGWHDALAIGVPQAVLGALAGGGILAFTSLGWRAITGTDGLAWGDVRMMAMIGSFVGPLPGAWMVLLMSSLLGSLGGIAVFAMRGRGGWLPFAPALAIAGIAWMLDGVHLVSTYLPGFAHFLPPGF